MTAVPWWISRTDGVRAPPGQGSSAAQRQANVRRAVSHVRRFIRANGLEYMWTLTYREADLPADRRGAVAQLRRFFERVQAKYGRLPVVAVIERGKRTGRLHVHLAADRWLPHAVMATLWGHGNVWVGDPGKLKGRTGARSLAGYLSKYITKDAGDVSVDGELDTGAHRYHVSQGWQPERVNYRAYDLPRALHILTVIYGVADQVCAFDVAAIPGMHGYWLSYGDDVTARARAAWAAMTGADPPV